MVPSAVGVQESIGGNNRPAPSSYKPEAQARGTLLPRLRFGLVKDGSADTDGRFAPEPGGEVGGGERGLVRRDGWEERGLYGSNQSDSWRFLPRVGRLWPHSRSSLME